MHPSGCNAAAFSPVNRLPKILLALAAVLLVAQAIRPMGNHGVVAGPNHVSTRVAVPAGVEQILRRSCYDCHSNHTDYPWYANVQPFGWWLEWHVRDGKKHLNFSEFAVYATKRADHKLEEVAEEVRERHMPLRSYLWVRPAARLSDEEVKTLAEWAAHARRALGAADGPAK